MRLTKEKMQKINEWEKEFDQLQNGLPDSITTIVCEGFDVDLSRDGLYDICLHMDFGESDLIGEDVISNILDRFPNRMTFVTKRSMAEFVVLNVLSYLKNS